MTGKPNPNSRSFLVNAIRRMTYNDPKISPQAIIERMKQLGRTDELSVYRVSRIMDAAKRTHEGKALTNKS